MPEINCVNTLDFPIVIVGRAGFSTLIHRTYVSRDKFRVRLNRKRTQAEQIRLSDDFLSSPLEKLFIIEG